MTTATTMTAKQFQNPLLRVLGDLTGLKAGQSVPGEDTYGPVMALMGIPDINHLGAEPSSGQPLVQRLIQWACKNLRKSGHVDLAMRGHWLLTKEGVEAAQKLTPALGTAPVPADPVPAPKAAPTPAPLPVPPVQKSLSDPYILNLVLDQTPCLGNCSDHGGSVCGTCPVRSSCLQTLHSRYAKAAASFRVTPAMPQAPTSATAPTQSPKAATPASPKSFNKDMANKIRAFEETICAECGKTIPKGEMSYWVDDANTGVSHMLHLACVEGA